MTTCNENILMTYKENVDESSETYLFKMMKYKKSLSASRSFKFDITSGLVLEAKRLTTTNELVKMHSNAQRRRRIDDDDERAVTRMSDDHLKSQK